MSGSLLSIEPCVLLMLAKC